MRARTIALLGGGRVGKKLGAGFAKIGHHVVLAPRDPWDTQLKVWVDAVGENTRCASYADAIADADVGELWRAVG